MLLLRRRQAQDAADSGEERAAAVGVQDRVDCRVGVTEDDGELDERQVGTAGEQRDGVHDVQRQPADGEHG